MQQDHETRDNPARARSGKAGNCEHIQADKSGHVENVSVPRKRLAERINETIRQELRRQRLIVSGMERTAIRHTVLIDILRDVLSNPDFIAILRRAGFPTIPRLICEHLLTEPPGRSAVPAEVTSPSMAHPNRDDSLAGLCMQADDLDNAKRLPARTVTALSRMTETRRIVAVSVMYAANNFSGDLARTLLLATPRDGQKQDGRAFKFDIRRQRRLARLEKRLIVLQAKAAAFAQDHSENLLYLALCSSYIRGWVQDNVVSTWLHMHCPSHATYIAQFVSDANEAKEPKRPMKLPYVRDHL